MSVKLTTQQKQDKANAAAQATAARMGHDLLNLPFSDMVKSIASGIAQAQFELDQTSLHLAQMMSGEEYIMKVKDSFTGRMEEEVREGVKVQFGGEELSLLELGFTPTFYQFVDTIIEVKMSLSMSAETSTHDSSTTTTSSFVAGGVFLGIGGVSGGKAKVSTVSASFASKFQYSAEGSSLIRTKLVPVPPPAILEERIRAVMNRAAPVTLTLDKPSDRVNTQKENIVPLTIKATYTGIASDLTFDVTGDPEGLTYDKNTDGQVTVQGKVDANAELGKHVVTVTVNDKQGQTANTMFIWTVVKAAG